MKTIPKQNSDFNIRRALHSQQPKIVHSHSLEHHIKDATIRVSENPYSRIFYAVKVKKVFRSQVYNHKKSRNVKTQ